MSHLPSIAHARRAAPGAAALAAALLAAGAAVPLAPAALAAQQRPAPAARPAAAAAPQALSLEEALALASTRSEAVRIARAGVQRARGTTLQARSGLFPQLDGSVSYQRAIQNQFNEISQQAAADEPAGPPPPPAVCAPEIPADATPEQRAAALAAAQTCPAGDGFGAIGQIFASPNTVVLGLSGSQTLFAGGRQIAGLRAARAGERAASLGVTAAQAQLRLDVTQAYFDAVLSDRLVSIAESSLVQAERTYRQTSIARQVGSTSEFESLRARVSRDNQRPVVIQTRAQRGIAYDRLRQLLDLPLDAPLALSTLLQDENAPAPALAAGPAPRPAPAPVVPAALRLDAGADELLAAALSEDAAAGAAIDSAVAAADTTAAGRNAVRQAGANVDARRQLLRVTRGQRLPAVALTGNYQRFAYPAGGVPTALNQYYPNFTVGVGLSLPILTGGRIRGEELVAQANLGEAEQQLRQSREFAALEARVAVNELTRAQAALQASAGTAEQASRAFQIAEVRFREGVSTQVELSDSRILLAQAQANRATAARDLQVARVRLALLRDLPLGAASGASQQQGGAGAAQQQQGGTSQGGGQQQQPSQQQGGAGVTTQASASQSGGNP